MEHPTVQGISLVGSTRTCRAVAEKCVRHKKRFQAMGGAKNHLVVMPDARIDEVIRNLLSSCFGCAGQRCMAASAIVAVGKPTYDDGLPSAARGAAAKVIVANPLDPAVAEEPDGDGPGDLGQAKQFIHEMIETGMQGRRHAGTRRARRHSRTGCEGGHFVGPDRVHRRAGPA